MKYTKEYADDLLKAKGVIRNIETLKNKTILVTGAGGLICSCVVDFIMNLNIKEKYNTKVYAADINKKNTEYRFASFMDNEYFHYIEYDVNEKLISDIKFDYIIHGASPSSPNMYNKYPVETMTANFIGTKMLLDYAKEHETKRFLYVSSSEVYGNKQGDEPFIEGKYYNLDFLNPRSCYPSAKRATETLCISYSKEYNIDTLIVRPGHVYGPTMTASDARAASQFAKDIIAGHDIIMKSEGVQMRSHCYVVDCVSALLTVLINGESTQAYNISNKDAISTIREIAEMYAKVGNKKVVFEVPSDVEKASYNMMDNSSLDSKKLENLGWKGLFNLEEGTHKTIEQYKK